MSLIQIKGTPSLFWGTLNTVTGNSFPTGAIIDSLELTPKNGEPIEVEDGNGLCANEILLRDGFNAKVSALYDAGKTWPVEGANAGLVIPFTGANATNIPFGESTVNGSVYNANTVTYTCLIASPGQTFKKKGEMMISYNLTYRPQVAV